MTSYLREIPTELWQLRMSSSMRHDRIFTNLVQSVGCDSRAALQD